MEPDGSDLRFRAIYDKTVLTEKIQKGLMEMGTSKKTELRKERQLLKKRKVMANRLFALGAVTMIAFIIYIVLVKVVNVAPIGPQFTVVGFSALNGAFHALTGVNMFWYKVTKVLGILAILTAAFFAGVGVFQLIKRRGIQNVDRTILSTGALYVVMMLFYVFFEKVVINYRPVIMEGESTPEASFPSTHTLLACVVFGSTIMIIGRYLGRTVQAIVLQVAVGFLMLLTVIGRLICGVHWFTDIVGGVLLSAALLLFYGGVITVWRSSNRRLKKKQKEKAEEFEYDED